MELYGMLLSQDERDWERNFNLFAKYKYVEFPYDLAYYPMRINEEEIIPYRYFDNSQGGQIPFCYLNVWYPETYKMIGNQKKGSKYYIKSIISDLAEKYPLIGRDGILYGNSFRRIYANPRNSGYTEPILDLLLDSDIKNLRFDDGMIHRFGYHKFSLSEREENEITQAQFDFYDALREGGKQVYVNGAWEPGNPHDSISNWVFPAKDHVDGVMIEIDVDHYTAGSSTAHGWVSYTDLQLRHILNYWLNLGKSVVFLIRYKSGKKNMGYETYEEFIKLYLKKYFLFFYDNNIFFATHNKTYHNLGYLPLLDKYLDNSDITDNENGNTIREKVDMYKLVTLFRTKNNNYIGQYNDGTVYLIALENSVLYLIKKVDVD